MEHYKCTYPKAFKYMMISYVCACENTQTQACICTYNLAAHIANAYNKQIPESEWERDIFQNRWECERPVI